VQEWIETDRMTLPQMHRQLALYHATYHKENAVGIRALQRLITLGAVALVVEVLAWAAALWWSV
jgi:hypothetical protein